MSDHHPATATVAPLSRAIASALSKPGLIAAAAGIALSPTAFAATYTVGNLNDSGAGSLRDAIAQANANAGDDVITFASNVSGTITLTSGSLHIYGGGVDVQGPGASVLTIAGNTQVTRPAGTGAYGGYSDIVINGGGGGGQGKPSATLAPTPVTISGITLTGGSAQDGGGINAYNTLLNVNNCVITSNNAYYSGGGIYIGGYYSALTVNNTTISNNTAGNTGGGVATTDAAINIQQSSVTGNTAGRGGGIHVHNDNSNAVTITASTVSGNTSTGNAYSYSSNMGGSGVYTRHVTTSISNSTIANNTSNAGYGGGFGNYIDSSGTYSTTLSNSTVSGNDAPHAGGVSENSDGVMTMTNTVVAGNTATYSDNDVGTHGGGMIAAAFSLIGDTGAATITDNGGNLLNVAPQLGALASNGGPTQTMLPLTGSPLIDAGDPAFSGLSTDQRGAGFPRIINGRVDIGAVETGTAATATLVPTPDLGLGGKLGLGALLGLAGLAVARRRRTLGTTAGILIAAALSLSSANVAQAAQGHETKTREAVTISSYSVDGKIATIVFGDGQTIAAPKWQVRVLDRRSNATSRQVRKSSPVASGTPAAVSYETGKDGKSHRVRIRLADSLQQAQALLARKP
ncbi:MAG: hypothetical protein DYH18_10000 [Xanthomonadales bacterium PRO7]|nr:hypothetical protein [Xanthomonadales bacterium PRO7]